MVFRFYEYGLYRYNASAVFVSYSDSELGEIQKMHDWAVNSFGRIVYSKKLDRYNEHLFMFQNDTNNKILMAAKLAFGGS